MPVKEIKPDIYSVGSIDWDRRLFDELIPLPDGTSYNAYIIKGSEKTVLIDTVDPAKVNDLLENLKKLNVNTIDYIVSNHAEQDHSGAIPEILEFYPDAKVITNLKCKNMLIDLLRIPENKFEIVNDMNTVSLGNKTLEFILTPWVHWPETMVTYLREDKILFTCDFFGSHFATSDLYAVDKEKVLVTAKRYYAEIMMPFRTNIKRNLKKLEDIDFNVIAPSHGPIYNEPEFIINAYKDWISDNVKNEVIIAYCSMHGSTAKMVQHFVNSLIEKGITVKQFNLTRTDIGELAMSLVDAATIVIGTPTVLVGPHPSVVYATYLVNVLRPKLKFASIIGTYSWGGKVVEQIKSLLSNIKVEIINSVIVKGYPEKEDLKALDLLAEQIYKKHKECNLL